MPYKYIGRTTDFKGKTLWELLGNLKNFGVGRVVARNMLERYPDPSYMKILKVETLASPKEISLDNVRKVRVLVEKTFRGQTFPKPVLLESTSYKADYKLIPKDEEAAYCQTTNKSSDKIYPRAMEFPPLLKELLLRDMSAKGKSPTDTNLQLEIVYNKRTAKSKYRIAKDGETPNVNIVMGLGTPISPKLYEVVKL